MPEADDAFDLGDDGRVLRPARLEELGHARQTAGDVLGLGDFLRDLGQNVADVDRLLLGHDQDGVGRQRERRDLLAALLDDDARVEALDAALAALAAPRLLLDDLRSMMPVILLRSSCSVHAFLDVRQDDVALVLGHDRHRVRVPLGDQVAGRGLGAVGDLQAARRRGSCSSSLTPVALSCDGRHAGAGDDDDRARRGF